MKVGLIAFGNEESYRLLFVGGELLRFCQKICHFDTQKEDVVKQVTDDLPMPARKEYYRDIPIC